MLKAEADQIKKGRNSMCCSNGAIHTELMHNELKELQNPPERFLELLQSNDLQKREEFLNNTMSYNNAFAFASVTSEKETDPTELGGRLDTCKYNGA